VIAVSLTLRDLPATLALIAELERERDYWRELATMKSPPLLDVLAAQERNCRRTG
jgi:hypothetical protein